MTLGTSDTWHQGITHLSPAFISDSNCVAHTLEVFTRLEQLVVTKIRYVAKTRWIREQSDRNFNALHLRADTLYVLRNQCFAGNGWRLENACIHAWAASACISSPEMYAAARESTDLKSTSSYSKMW